MPPSVPISALLNTDSDLPESPRPNSLQVDVRHHITSVSDLLSRPSLCAPPHIAEHLLDVINYFSLDDYSTEHTQVNIPLLIRQPLPLGVSSGNRAPLPNTRHNIKHNRITTLSTLYTYEDSNVYVEYPDTNPAHPVGYLFRCDPRDWQDPTRNFAYSLGKPAGQTKIGEEVHSELLVGKDGKRVPCVESHFTCMYRFILKISYSMSELSIGQGVKVCPMSDLTNMKTVHTCASREDIKMRLCRDRQRKLDTASPSRDIFEKTLAFISALQKNGCPAPLHEPTFLSQEEEGSRNAFLEHTVKIQRGYTPSQRRCEGRLYLMHTNDGFTYIRWADLPAHFPHYTMVYLNYFLVANIIPELETETTIFSSSTIHMMSTILKPTSTRTWRGLIKLRRLQHWTDMVHFLPAQQLPTSLHSVCAAVSLFFYDLMLLLI
jgi:hypothetical protein